MRNKKILSIFIGFALSLVFIGLACTSRESDGREMTNYAQVDTSEQGKNDSKAATQNEAITSVSPERNTELTFLEEYEEEFGHYFKNYLGYYFWAENPNEIYIIRLSMEGHLILQGMIIRNDELMESGRRKVLDHIVDFGRSGLIFVESNDTRNLIHRSDVFLDIYRDGRRDFSITFRTPDPTFGHLSVNRRMSIESSFFTPNTDNVVPLFFSRFSRDAQRRYTGTFAFCGYEITHIHNMDNPINERDIENTKFIVEMDEEGFLFATIVSADESSILRDRFFIADKSKIISSSVGDGGFMSFYAKEFYADEDTIIQERSFSQGTDDDSGWWRGYSYRIIFRRETIL